MKELIAIEEQQLKRCFLQDWDSSVTGAGMKSVGWQLDGVSHGITMNMRHPDPITGHCPTMIRFFKRGELHRVGGPAESDGHDEVYAMNGKEISIDEFNFWAGIKQ